VYELIILSLLMQTPAHGYLIAKIINDMFGPYTKISNGRLYPLLARLEEEKYIETCPELELAGDESGMLKGARQQRQYRITAAGRERFERLMMDTSSNPGEYQRIFLHKMRSLDLLAPDEQLYLLNHYINYCHAHILHLDAESEDLARKKHPGLTPTRRDASINTMRHMQEHWRLDMAWAQQRRAQVIAVPTSEQDGEPFSTGVPEEHRHCDSPRPCCDANHIYHC
jgi:DNA-binding PadR family transcriptional regulator